LGQGASWRIAGIAKNFIDETHRVPFMAVKHSGEALALLQTFVVRKVDTAATIERRHAQRIDSSVIQGSGTRALLRRWKTKLFNPRRSLWNPQSWDSFAS